MNIAQHMAAVARHLLGAPDQEIKTKSEWRYGTRGSLAINIKKGVWHDHETDEKGGVLDLIRRERNLVDGAAYKWMHDELGIDVTPANARQIVAEYDYVDEAGKLLFQVVRYEPKDFRQRRPDGRGDWIWGLEGVRRVLFRLPAVLTAKDRTIHIAEGEKGVKALERLGLVATCSPQGAGKWREEFSPVFRGADVIIFPDNDPPGEAHAKQVAASLCGVAKRIRIVRLPGLPPKGDVFNWIAAGGAAAALTQLCDVPEVEPAPAEHRAKLNGAGNPHTDDTPRADGAESTQTEDGRPPEFTDEALALAFADRNKDRLQYVAKWGVWLLWDGARWRHDETLRAFDLARHVCRDAAMRCNKHKIAVTLASAKTVAAVERLAEADRRLAATVGQWDADLSLLNTPAGVVDLRTGRVLAHRPDGYFTKITAVGPGGKCPRWLEFLERVTGGDVELQEFLARVFGYAATGSTKEHALFFAYGLGGNGKSVLLSTVSSVLGDYAQTAPIETFTASTIERHPTELAGLRGARLVTATETEEGRRWAEARIKALTGGDKISARFMRQDFFEFTPQFKLVIAGNHKPGLRTVDEAIRRRFNLIPFSVTIPPDERDPNLTEKLKAEWPGILQWIVDGCRAWHDYGLQAPKIVTDATAAYLQAEDAFLAWLDERCLRDPQAWGKSSDLFADWKEWAVKTGEPPGTQKRFSQNLEARGFAIERRHTGRGFGGLQLIPTMTGGGPCRM